MQPMPLFAREPQLVSEPGQCWPPSLGDVASLSLIRAPGQPGGKEVMEMMQNGVFHAGEIL